MQLNKLFAILISNSGFLVSGTPLADPDVLGKRDCLVARDPGAGCVQVNDAAEMQALLQAPDSAVKIAYNRIIALDVKTNGCWVAGDAAMAGLQDEFARWTGSSSSNKRDADPGILLQARTCPVSCTGIGNSACNSGCPTCEYETLCNADCACATYGVCRS